MNSEKTVPIPKPENATQKVEIEEKILLENPAEC